MKNIEEATLSEIRNEFVIMLEAYTKAQLQFLTCIDDVSKMTRDPQILQRFQRCLAEVQSIHVIAKAASQVKGAQT